MLETIDQWVNTVVNWLLIIPVQAWAIMAGIFIGCFSTQWLKRTFPAAIIFPKMPKQMQVMWIRITALLFAALPAYFIWPGPNAIWAALAVGFGTPMVYRVTSFFIYKRWPELEARLSGTGK